MEKIIKKNDIELLNESLDIKLSDAYKINLGNDYLINTKLGLAFDYCGDFIGKILNDVSPVLPYTVLDYCFFNQSPVPTDIYQSTSWGKVEISISSTGTVNNTFLFGSRSGSSGTDKIQIQNNNTYSRYAFTFGSNTAVYCTIDDLTTRTDFEITGTTVTYTNEGVTDSKSVGSDTGFKDCDYPICIGGLQNASAIATAKMIGYFWGAKIYDNNNDLIHNIIPVQMKIDDTICLLDTVTNTYYYPIEGTQLLPEQPVGLMMFNPGSLQMNLNGDDEEDI